MQATPVAERIKVLFLDDNPEDIAIVQRLLGQYRGASFDLVPASSPASCLEHLQEDGADVLLLDHSLPGEDGISFLRRIAELRELPPVIVLTGRGDERLAVEAMRSGACDYFPKDAITPSGLGGALVRALESFHQGEESRSVDEQIIVALAAAAEGKDHTTGGHLQRICRYAVMLGEELGLDSGRLQTLRYGALLHDIGKLAVDQHVLQKPSALTAEEWEEIRQHPLVGERLCACLWLARSVAPVIRHHHERWDGSGYVDGLSGTDIPLLARIVSVADAFDAMTTDRPYRKALDQRTVVGQLQQGSGSQWDPDIVQSFLGVLRREHLWPAAASTRDLRRAA